MPVTWSVTGYDWRRREPAERIGGRCVKARDGDVILLHDGSHLEPEAIARGRWRPRGWRSSTTRRAARGS